MPEAFAVPSKTVLLIRARHPKNRLFRRLLDTAAREPDRATQRRMRAMKQRKAVFPPWSYELAAAGLADDAMHKNE
jgi:hypothetical protein